eukprot:gene4176-8300_t
MEDIEYPQKNCEKGNSDALCSLTNGPTTISGWNCSVQGVSVKPICNSSTTSWTGIKCKGGSITEINLSNKHLTGSLSTSLGQIKSIEVLSLFSNSIQGSIPTSLGDLSALRVLALYSNSLTGSLPAELCNAPLQTLLMQKNSRMTCYADCLSTIAGFDSGYMAPCNDTVSPTMGPTQAPTNSTDIKKNSIGGINSDNYAEEIRTRNLIIILVVILGTAFCFVTICIGRVLYKRYIANKQDEVTAPPVDIEHAHGDTICTPTNRLN